MHAEDWRSNPTVTARGLCMATLAVLLLGAGCRTPERHDPPEPPIRTVYEEVARGSEAIAGEYRLVALDGSRVPVPAALVRGCRVWLPEGTLALGANGRYRLALVSETICGDRDEERHEIVKEGLFSLVGFTVRFGDKMVITSDEPAPEMTEGPEELVEVLFPHGRFSARGSVRVGRVTATMDDLRTFTFDRVATASAATAP